MTLHFATGPYKAELNAVEYPLFGEDKEGLMRGIVNRQEDRIVDRLLHNSRRSRRARGTGGWYTGGTSTMAQLRIPAQHMAVRDESSV